MFFRQVLYRDLGCASYVLGDHGEAVVVDPRWDIDVYLELAADEGLTIVQVLDTHDHADHVSGRLRLAAATGARARRADPTGEDPDGIAAGEEIAVGDLRILAVASPGHRPEHLAFAVCDLARGHEPWMLLTGDSLLVGDIARPDLAYEATEGAQALHATLRQLTGVGDQVEVWPAHVGGSLCGGDNLSGKTNSTVGFERRHNPLLLLGETEFVGELTESLPSRPPNIEQIVALNRRREADPLPALDALDPDALRPLLAAGVTVLDARAPEEFDRGHLRNAINLPVASPGVGTRAGWALSPDEQIVVVAAEPRGAQRMISALQAVGFWHLAGFALADLEAWRAAGLDTAESGSWDLDRVAAGLQDHIVELVDVREPSEWARGHVPGSHHVPLHRMRDIESVPTAADGRTTAVACAAGARAAFAASLLRRAGHDDVVRVTGGGVPDLGARGLELQSGRD
ncbi:MAG TPA: rhodanese-like domain-containing protein [Solirubrobacteraceae bacterium]